MQQTSYLNLLVLCAKQKNTRRSQEKHNTNCTKKVGTARCESLLTICLIRGREKAKILQERMERKIEEVLAEV